MKAKELRDLKSEELIVKARIKMVKKDIARVKTILAERKLNETRA